MMKRRDDIVWGLIMLALLYVTGFILFSIHAHASEPELIIPCRGEFGQRCRW